MRSLLTRSFVTLAVTVSAVLCAHFRLKAASETVSASSAIEIDGHGAVLLPVRLNGEGPFPFLVDTGATSSAIADTLAHHLKLSPIGKVLASNPTGSAEFDIVSIASATASGRSIDDLHVVVMRSASLNRVAPRAVGILGEDVLRQASFTIDYERARFAWAPVGETTDRRRALVLKWARGRWLVNLPQGSKRADALWMVADSGASAFVFFDRGAPLGVTTSPLTLPVGVTTVGGAALARGVLVRELRAGPATFHDKAAVIIDRRADDVDSDGLLPLCAFARVTFDVTTRTLTVEERR